MDVNVSLVDANGKAIVDRVVNIAATLAYEDDTDVLKKSLLKVSPDSKLVIDRTGKALVKFRVEDVSKNHQVIFSTPRMACICGSCR